MQVDKEHTSGRIGALEVMIHKLQLACYAFMFLIKCMDKLIYDKSVAL